MNSVRLGILSDLHRAADPRQRFAYHNEYDFAGHLARVGNALAWFEQQEIDAVVLCGDLTHTADERAMVDVLTECSAQCRVPVIVVSGNHDVSRNHDLLAESVERLRSSRVLLGDPSGDLISGIRVAGVHVAPTTGESRSRLQAMPAVREWGDEPVVLVSHLPILSRASAVAARGMQYPGDLLDRTSAAQLLLGRTAPTIVLAGHIHVRDVQFEGPVLQIVQAALIEPPFEAAVLEVLDAPAGLVVSRRTRRTSEQRAGFEPILARPVGSWRFADRRWAVVGAHLEAVRGDAGLGQAVGDRR